jgi:hypothetical protein
MKSVGYSLCTLFVNDKAYPTAICRVGVGFSVKPTSLRVPLPVRITDKFKAGEESNEVVRNQRRCEARLTSYGRSTRLYKHVILTRTSEYCAKGCYGRRGWPGSRSTHFGLSCPLRYIHITLVRSEVLFDPT